MEDVGGVMNDVLILALGGVVFWLLTKNGVIGGGSSPSTTTTSTTGSTTTPTSGNFVPVPPGVPISLPATPVVLPVGPLNPESAGLVNVPQSPPVQAPIGPTLTSGQTITHVVNTSGQQVPVAAAPHIPGPEDPGTIVAQGATLQYLYSYVTALPGYSPTKQLRAGDWSADVHGAAMDLPAYNPLLFGLDPATMVTFDQFFQLASQYYATHPSPTAFMTFSNMSGLGFGVHRLAARSAYR